MTVTQTNNRAFKGSWSLYGPIDGSWCLQLDGKHVLTFSPDVPERIIHQITAFCQTAHNLEISNFVHDIPRLFITVNQETLAERQSFGETVAVIEVTRNKDQNVARFTTAVCAYDDGSVSASIRSQKKNSDTTRDVAGSFVNYNYTTDTAKPTKTEESVHEPAGN